MGHLSERNGGSPLVILRSVKGRHCGDTPRDAVSAAEQRNYKRDSRFMHCIHRDSPQSELLPQINISFMLRKIATRYGLDGPGIESRWGRDFPHHSTQALGPTQPPTQWVPCPSRGYAAGEWRRPPTPSTAEVKERVELYLYSL